MNNLHLMLGLRYSFSPSEPRSFLEDAWARLGSPVLQVLGQFPQLRIALHISGTILDLLDTTFQEDALLLKELVGAGQVEAIAGGYYDPVLSAIPERDALGQVQLSRRKLESLLSATVNGSWILHGAWDPCLPRLLVKAGMRYAVLDGWAFRQAGLAKSALRGFYMTEREGAALALFPLHEDLAGTDPGDKPSQVLARLRRISALEPVGSISCFIDARRFLDHPGCLLPGDKAEPWLVALVRILARNDHWLKTNTFWQALRQGMPAGSLYLPSSLNPAMLAQLMTPKHSSGLSMLSRLKRTGQSLEASDITTFFGGGPWEAFLTRHAEANRLHKRMIRASREVARLASLRKQTRNPKQQQTITLAWELARRELYRSQTAAPYSHDYWGGVFSGASRHEAYAALLRAEMHVLRTFPARERFRFQRADYDCDRNVEVLVTTPFLGAIVDPDQGGSLAELDSWALPGNLLNTFTRREQLWYSLFNGNHNLPALVRDRPPFPGRIHDATGVVEPLVDLEIWDTEEGIEEQRHPHAEAPGRDEIQQLAKDLAALGVWHPCNSPITVDPTAFQGRQMALDRFTRNSFMDRFLGEDATLRNFAMGQFPEEGDFVGSSYSLLRVDHHGSTIRVNLARDGFVSSAVPGMDRGSVRLVKRYIFLKTRPVMAVEYEITNRYREPLASRFGVELNLNLDSSRGEKQYLLFDDGTRMDLSQELERESCSHVTWIDEDRGIRFKLSPEPDSRLWVVPIETVAPVRGAFHVSFQGMCLLFSWPMSLWGEERRELAVRCRLET